MKMDWVERIAVAFALLVLGTAIAHGQVSAFAMDGHNITRVTTKDGKSFLIRAGQGGEGTGQNNHATKDDLFTGTEQFEKNATSVTEITMDPDSLDMVKGHSAADAHTTVLNVVRTYSYDKPGMYDMGAVDKYREKLNTGDWFCSVHTRELKTGSSTDVCRKHRTDDMHEEAIITIEPKELTFIHSIKRNGGGHSESSGLPMFIGPGSMPMVARLNPAFSAEMMANMKAWQAEHIGEMKEWEAEMKANGAFHIFSDDGGKTVLQLREFHGPATAPFPPLAPLTPKAKGAKPVAPLPPASAVPAPAPAPEVH